MRVLIKILTFWVCLNYLESCSAFPRRDKPFGQFVYRVNSGPSQIFEEPSIAIEFPSEGLNYEYQPQGWIRAQRAVNSRAKQQSNYVHPSRIVFNEDNDEPLAPEPLITTRKPTRRPQSTSTKIPVVVTNNPKVKVPSRTETSKNPINTSTKKPVVVLTTTSKRPTTMRTTTVNIPLEAESPECVENKPGDCDEIFEGSIYTPFRVHRPKEFKPRGPQRRIQRMPSRQSNTGLEWSYV